MDSAPIISTERKCTPSAKSVRTRPAQGLVSILFAVLLSTLCACGGPQPAPVVTQATEDTSNVVLLVAGDGDLARAIQSRLTQAGYRVVHDSGDEHHAVVNVVEHTTQNQGFFKVVVNGRERVSYTTRATVTLLSSGVAVATASAQYDPEEQIAPEDLNRIVSAITDRAIITRLASRVQDQKAFEAEALEEERRLKKARMRAAEEAEKKKAHDEDEAAWAQVIVAECTTPREEDACLKVKAYLANYPTGLHAQEARTAMEQGTMAIAAMVEERAWNAVNVAACREPRSSTDCVAAEKYINDFPTGIHVAEAREAIDSTRDKREKLAQQEAREAEREAKRIEQEEKKAALESCKDDCREACVNWRTGGVRAPCFNRCVALECR